MTQTLRQKQTLGLIMTPRLQQAIKLLQYNHQELLTHIEKEMLENPTLEAVPDSDGGELSEGINQLEAGARESSDAEQNNGSDEGIDWEKFLEQASQNRVSSGPTGGTIYDDLPPIETNLTYGESLADHLIFQLHLHRCSDDEQTAAEAIILNLDHRGYLQVSVEELAIELGQSADDVDFARGMVMQFDPVGCGATDLSDCLVAQARIAFPEDPNFVSILTDHLRNLERRNYQAISRDLDLDLVDVHEYHRMIQELEPHPGRGYGGDDARYITPDLYVVKRSGGEWDVVLNEEGVPDLRISGYYRKIMAGASKSDKEYLLDKLRGAEFLIKSINKRRKTIRRVMDSILKSQHDFFEHGAGKLRPLILQQVADDVGVHMSTVSRVTSNKYVHTPHGIFELKYFFTAGVMQSSGAELSAEAIRSHIKTLLANEDTKKPYSDQAISNYLKEHGIRVARRTVAKYREQLGVLPSNQRKQMF